MPTVEADVGLGIPCQHTGCAESPLDSDAVRVCPCEQDSEMGGFLEILISDCYILSSDSSFIFCIFGSTES